MIDPKQLGKIFYEWFSTFNKLDVFYHRDIATVGIRPTYKSEGAAGCDLAAYQETCLPAKQVTSVSTEVRLAIPDGHFGFIKERSSIGKKGMWCVGGIIDSDYRGEIKVMIYNSNDHAIQIASEERIANLIIIPYKRADFNPTSYLPPTSRGDGGFGSTGQ